jgi:simple sugar transport system ATP-binding protein
MVGDIETQATRPHESRAEEKVILELKDLVVEGSDTPLNLRIHSGEIIGLLGLIGAGKTELAETLFGMRKPVSGEIWIGGQAVAFGNIRDAIGHGVHMVPENRAVNAILPEHSIKDNITIPFLNHFSTNAVLLKEKERQGADTMIDNMGIKCEGHTAKIESLSGGNQQKVVVARWLSMPHSIVILDEPFQGVDIKSRKDINTYLRQSTTTSAVLMISSDIDELMDVTDRVVVMNKGKILDDTATSDADRDKLLRLITQE